MKIYIKSAVASLSEESWDTQNEIARDPNTSTALLDELASITTYSKWSDKLYYICCNPNVSLDTVLRFYEEYPEDVRFAEALAQHKDAPPAMLDDLVETTRYGKQGTYYMDCVAKNPNTLLSTLIKMFKHRPNNRIIWEVLSTRSDVPTEVISKLLDELHGHFDQEDDILLNIINNNDLTQEQFEQIYFLVWICGLSFPKVSLFLAKSDKTPPKVLEDFVSISGHYYPDVRRAIYENPNTPETTKEWLYKRYFAGT